MLKRWIDRVCGRIWPPALRDYLRWHEQAFGRLPPVWQIANLRISQMVHEHPRTRVRIDAVATPIELRIGTSDYFVFDQVFVDREYDIDFPPPMRIIDAGANVGLATLWFANRHPQAQIIAVEPDAENFVQLQRNMRAYPNVRCVQAGVWHRRSRLRVVDSATHAWAFRFEECDDGEGIQTQTIDDLVDGFTPASVDLLKLDIEGAEREVVSASGRWVDQVTTVIVECHDRDVPGCTEAVQTRFSELAFDRRTCGENLVLVRREISVAARS